MGNLSEKNGKKILLTPTTRGRLICAPLSEARQKKNFVSHTLENGFDSEHFSFASDYSFLENIQRQLIFGNSKKKTHRNTHPSKKESKF